MFFQSSRPRLFVPGGGLLCAGVGNGPFHCNRPTTRIASIFRSRRGNHDATMGAGSSRGRQVMWNLNSTLTAAALKAPHCRTNSLRHQIIKNS